MSDDRPAILSRPLFLGSHGEGVDLLGDLITRVLKDHGRYRAGWVMRNEPRITMPGSAELSGDLLRGLDELLERLHATYPYFHPRYAAQMIKDPAIPAILGYFAAMLMNPNNHSYEGGPATTEMELEFIESLLRLVGFERQGRPEGWGHLCSGGSLANLEALWAVRDTREEGAVLFSRASHHSWKRNATILRIPEAIEVEVDSNYRLDVDHLESILKKRRVVMVVANVGTTGTGSVDPIDEILGLRDRFEFHLHVDAAYGGYARACLRSPRGGLLPFETVARCTSMSGYVYRQLEALGGADSITLDPHKHGLCPYGAGSILYRHEALKRPLLNSAPYTYHLTDRPNLGTTTLECSRPGASAAACWLTGRLVPADASGFGAFVGASIRVTRELYERACVSNSARALHEPDLDILCLVRLPFPPEPGSEMSLGSIDEATAAFYSDHSVTSQGRPPVIVSRLSLPADMASRSLPFARTDVERVAALRLVLMKHWLALPEGKALLEEIADALFG